MCNKSKSENATIQIILSGRNFWVLNKQAMHYIYYYVGVCTNETKVIWKIKEVNEMKKQKQTM